MRVLFRSAAGTAVCTVASAALAVVGAAPAIASSPITPSAAGRLVPGTPPPTAAPTGTPLPATTSTGTPLPATTSTGTPLPATTSTGTPLPAAVAPAPVALPGTPVGRQVDWLVRATRHLPITAADARAHIDQAFFSGVGGLDALNTALRSIAGPGGLRPVSVLASTPTTLGAVVDGSQRWQLNASVDAAGLLASLVFVPYRPTPTSWSELDRRLGAVAPEISFQADALTPDGQCVPVHGVAARTARPLGSAFKLFVLAALADDVAAGRASWDEKLAIRDDWKSLPSGVLQNSPAGTTYTLLQYAQYMISISDNTAADHLLHRVGREAVERQLALADVRQPELDVPFLTTRELFQLKGAPDDQATLRTYLALPRSRRLAYLTDVVDRRPLTGLTVWQQPRAVDTVEWFASPADICHVYANLARAASTPSGAPLAGVLSLNDGGVGLIRDRWPTVWFKGGSEPGVLTLTYLARDRRGTTVVVSVEASDPAQAFDEATVTPELLALARGGVVLGTAAARHAR